MSDAAGLVSFVNLGPGDPKLRTERAADRVAAADVVILDDEVRIETLFELARAGKRVVRAVAGDVLGSAHVVAEAVALAHAGIAIEVVPGVVAAAAAAAFAGVLGRAVYVRASEVGDAVRAEPPDAPVTLVAGASLPSQRVVTTTARSAPDDARAFGEARVLVAMGAPEPALRWFERRPLFGKRILVTRAREQAGGTAALLRELGADPWVVPTIDLRAPADPAPLALALADLRRGAYTWAAFTSANGVERTWTPSSPPAPTPAPSGAPGWPPSVPPPPARSRFAVYGPTSSPKNFIDKLEVVVNQMKKEEARDDKKHGERGRADGRHKSF